MFSKLVGIWLAIDGLGSYVVYKKQSFLEHIPRLIRMSLGIGLLLLPLPF